MGAESVKIKKILLYLFSLIILNGCVETTALLGPAITASNTGNIYHASFSYASNKLVINTTGKTPFEHVASFIDPIDLETPKLSLILEWSLIPKPMG